VCVSSDLLGINPALNGMILYYRLMTKWSGLGDSTELSQMGLSQRWIELAISRSPSHLRLLRQVEGGVCPSSEGDVLPPPLMLMSVWPFAHWKSSEVGKMVVETMLAVTMNTSRRTSVDEGTFSIEGMILPCTCALLLR
jgi:hypothetical protein